MQKLPSQSVRLFFLQYFFIWILPYLFLNGVFFLGQAAEEINISYALIASLSISVFLILLAFSYMWSRLTVHYYRYELTDMGFKKESGVIFKQYVTIPYNRIQNVDIYRGILARLLGLSDLQIQTAGTSASMGKYGMAGTGAEGRLPGLFKEEAEKIRDELIRRTNEK